MSVFLINQDNYQLYNRDVARELGSVNASIMLSELINRYEYHLELDELTKVKNELGKWFYYTIDKCTERTILSRKEQDSAIKKLLDMDLICKKSVGVPPRRFFKLNMTNIKNFFKMIYDKKNSILSKKDKLKCPKRTNRNVQKGQHKNPIEEPQEEDNNKKPSAVVVFPCLDKLKISDNKKKDLSKKLTEQNAKLLVKRVLCYNDRLSDLHGVNTILKHWENWGDKLDMEKVIQENESFLEKSAFRDGSKINKHHVSIGQKSDGKYIEFVCGVRVEEFKTKNKNFIKDLIEFSKDKLNLNIEKGEK